METFLMPRIIQNISAKLSASVREETLGGRDYIVAPLVLAVEGVMNGSAGRILYPGSELSRAPQAWDHKPIIVYHPNGTTANTPDELNAKSVGILLNTHYADGKLKAEAWLEKERLAIVDTRVMVAIDASVPMEVSTGVYTENEQTAGEFNGDSYDAIARNLVPDHLAILPDQIGACSVLAGAGLLMNALSHANIEDRLRLLLTGELGEEPWPYIEGVFTTHVVYNFDGKTYKRPYATDSETEEIHFTDPAEQVRVIIEYRTVNNSLENGDSKMTKQILVDALVANTATHWTEADRPTLNALDEPTLQKMDPVVPVTDATPPPVPS